MGIQITKYMYTLIYLVESKRYKCKCYVYPYEVQTRHL